MVYHLVSNVIKIYKLAIKITRFIYKDFLFSVDSKIYFFQHH